MDEPTAGLDPFMQEEFMRLVGELREDGTTRLPLSSHNLPGVQRMCDRVSVLREGLVVVEGRQPSTFAIASESFPRTSMRYMTTSTLAAAVGVWSGDTETVA